MLKRLESHIMKNKQGFLYLIVLLFSHPAVGAWAGDWFPCSSERVDASCTEQEEWDPFFGLLKEPEKLKPEEEPGHIEDIDATSTFKVGQHYTWIVPDSVPTTSFFGRIRRKAIPKQYAGEITCHEVAMDARISPTGNPVMGASWEKGFDWECVILFRERATDDAGVISGIPMIRGRLDEGRLERLKNYFEGAVRSHVLQPFRITPGEGERPYEAMWGGDPFLTERDFREISSTVCSPCRTILRLPFAAAVLQEEGSNPLDAFDDFSLSEGRFYFMKSFSAKPLVDFPERGILMGEVIVCRCDIHGLPLPGEKPLLAVPLG